MTDVVQIIKKKKNHFVRNILGQKKEIPLILSINSAGIISISEKKRKYKAQLVHFQEASVVPIKQKKKRNV